MSPLPLPTQTLAWLNQAADAGQCNAQVMLHLLDRADARDRDVAKFLDSYTATIAALCRRLEALERAAGLRHPTPPAPANDDPVADALTKAETVLTRVGDEGFDMHDLDEAANVFAAIRLVMRQRGIRTSDSSPAPTTPPAAPVPVAECPNCGYEGEMVQAPQAGEVAVESGLTRQSAFHCFRSRLAEEGNSRYPQTSQDAEVDAFASGASWAWATYATAIAGSFGQAPQAGDVEA